MLDISMKADSLSQTDCTLNYIRPRLNALLHRSVKKPMTIVCAGMGCGKTQAVYDFSNECGMPVVLMQLSESDNIIFHFWENLVRSIAKTDRLLANELRKLGFPGTEDKLNKYLNIRSSQTVEFSYLVIYDDFHLIKNAEVLYFLERATNNLPKNRSVIIISRDFPQINISSLMVRDKVSLISEDELNFTEGELHHFLLKQGLDPGKNSLSKIHKDTKGWAFIINFVARMLKKTPGYAGYVQAAIKQGIFQLIETESWDSFSEQLRHLFLRLSLTDHRSAELVGLLANGNEPLISQLRQQNAFVRFEQSIDYYHVHHLFLDFLHSKQQLLSDEEIETTYKTVADWCIKNEFIVDALLNYEKVCDYESIISILYRSSTRFLMENVRDLLGILDRVTENVFDTVEISAAMYIQLVINSGDLRKAIFLLKHYESKYLKLPEDSAFKNRMLGFIYYHWAVLRLVLCTIDDKYDSDTYFAKSSKYFSGVAIKEGYSWYQHPPGIWSGLAGSSRAGAPDDYLDAVSRSMQYFGKFAPGLCEGSVDLCQSEMLFYQAKINQSEFHIKNALDKARKYEQHEIVLRALFYSLRIAVCQGDYAKIELTLKDMENLLEKSDNTARFLAHDTILGWYYYTLDLPAQMPYWLKEKFVFSVFYSNTMENFGNHIKAKYRYLTNDYADLLDYIEKKKAMDILLYERIELLALESCARHKMKDNEAAISVLQEAYRTALPNHIAMPFIELGKDMRALITAASNSAECTIPQTWLRDIKQKASAYSKNQAQITSKHMRISEVDSKIVLTPRETEVLQCLCDGLSRSEIASKFDLSVNTIKVHINSIYVKLNAHNRADVYRIAFEKALL